MMTRMVSVQPQTDAELVGASLSGDRDAFAHIVSRYQSLVCSLAYSATGSLAQSEDLAQDTFVTAWKQLGKLNEREKLRPWLCGIARNLINNWLRKQGREPSHRAESLEEVSENSSPEPLPLERTISNEEAQILWRSLELIPDNYREPLILFYREHQSIEAVAAHLDLTEDAVKQRLSRGRKMLHEQVLSFVEGALARTNPGKVFTLSVLAALPVTFASSAKAVTLAAAAAKGGATASGTTFVSVLGVLLGPAIGLICGYFGLRMGYKGIRSPRERAAITRYVVMVGVTVTVFIVTLMAIVFCAGFLWKHHPILYISLGLGLTAAYGVMIFVTATRFNTSFVKLRDEERRAHPEYYNGNDGMVSMLCTPWEYRSRATLLGLPLVHCRWGRLPGQKGTRAVGWIACADRAYGILFASGGFAVGGISIGAMSVGVISVGGFSIGVLPFGGMALGVIALGGAAIGWVASGGFAIAWHAAYGGVAAAHELAVGGAALAHHANDAIARAFFIRHYWLDTERTTTRNVFYAICFSPIFFVLLQSLFIRRRQLKLAKQKQSG